MLLYFFLVIMVIKYEWGGLVLCGRGAETACVYVLTFGQNKTYHVLWPLLYCKEKTKLGSVD